MNLRQKIGRVVKKEALLVIAFFGALLSMFAIKPSMAYLDYIDFKSIGLLFCLMCAVQGLKNCNVFETLAQKILVCCNTTKKLTMVLIVITFVTAMLITNDVALITLVPFSIFILRTTKQSSRIPLVVVLQTIAANLGSMGTPIGNPQNLYIFSFFELSSSAFFKIVGGITVLSLVGLLVAVGLLRSESVQIQFEEVATVTNCRLVVLYTTLFCLCLGAVLGSLDYRVLVLVVVVSLLFFSPYILKRVDYSLLLTFICFFIFSGNIGQIPVVKELLVECLNQSTFLTSILASQVISNVPAAVLLSGFTQNWQQLLLGVNIGGLGTPIASLASIISIKYYFIDPQAEKAHFWKLFFVANLLGLVVLIPFAMWIA